MSVDKLSEQKICLLGATGSIGLNTLDVVRKNTNRFSIQSMAANRNWKSMVPLITEFRPKEIAMFEPKAAKELAQAVGQKVLTGMEGLLEIVSDSGNNFVINGLVGSVGCEPTIRAIELGKKIGLANKESLVMAGEIINELLRSNPESSLLPIDSEHSAILQSLGGRPFSEIEEIQLTASGGPFRQKELSEFGTITKADALNHPTWNMGEKITIDSATLMNKGLEVIEAHYLFGTPIDKIRVIVHPSSIVHSLVQFCDGSLMAQLGSPDMRLPIQYCLTFPERIPLGVERLDLAQIGRLEFYTPDFEKFPCLRLAFEAGRLGGTSPAILNAANEVAVSLFLEERISFTDIPVIIEKVMEKSPRHVEPKLEEILLADEWSREVALSLASDGRNIHV